MCTECLTKHIRTLVEPDEHGWYYTLRGGNGIFSGGFLICGPQDELAVIELTTDDEDGKVRYARQGDDPANVRSFVRIIDPVEWVHFFNAYTRALGAPVEDHYDILVALENEVRDLLPRLEELMKDPFDDMDEAES